MGPGRRYSEGGMIRLTKSGRPWLNPSMSPMRRLIPRSTCSTLQSRATSMQLMRCCNARCRRFVAGRAGACRTGLAAKHGRTNDLVRTGRDHPCAAASGSGSKPAGSRRAAGVSAPGGSQSHSRQKSGRRSGVQWTRTVSASMSIPRRRHSITRWANGASNAMKRRWRSCGRRIAKTIVARIELQQSYDSKWPSRLASRPRTQRVSP